MNVCSHPGICICLAVRDSHEYISVFAVELFLTKFQSKADFVPKTGIFYL